MSKRYLNELMDIMEEHGFDTEEAVELHGYQLPIHEYLNGVSKRDKDRVILNVLQSLPNDVIVRSFIRGSIHRIIAETNSGNPDYVSFYQPRIQRAN